MSFNSCITQNVDAKFKDCEILNLSTEDLDVKGDLTVENNIATDTLIANDSITCNSLTS